MDNKVKTTRKNFLKWSGLAAISGFLLNGKRLSHEISEGDNKSGRAQSIGAHPRIRSAQNTVVRKSV